MIGIEGKDKDVSAILKTINILPVRKRFSARIVYDVRSQHLWVKNVNIFLNYYLI